MGTIAKYPMLGNFTVQKFASKDELWDYIGGKQYGMDDVPAICFGF
jgi:hypothetical protein